MRMPPLKKGDVRQALDKRIEAARRRHKKLVDEGEQEDRVAVAQESAKLNVLQNVRKELFGERLPKKVGPKA